MLRGNFTQLSKIFLILIKVLHTVFLAVVGEGEGGAGCTKLCETFLVSGATP